jgi:hypothetical protein
METIYAAAVDAAFGAGTATAVVALIALLVRANIGSGTAYAATIRTVRREYEAIIAELRGQMVRMATDHATELAELRAELAELRARMARLTEGEA